MSIEIAELPCEVGADNSARYRADAVTVTEFACRTERYSMGKRSSLQISLPYQYDAFMMNAAEVKKLVQMLNSWLKKGTDNGSADGAR